MSNTFIESATHDNAVLGQRGIRHFWANLKGVIVPILERACNVARIDELDTYERKRFERLIESLDRAERIRRHSKTWVV